MASWLPALSGALERSQEAVQQALAPTMGLSLCAAALAVTAVAPELVLSGE